MKDIFTNLFNKVVSFFHQEEEKQDSAKDVACNRLKLVLMQDRTNLSPAIMDRMKHELIDLLSKYVELDKELVDLNFEQEDNQMALMLSIPVIRAKDESEIEEILKEEEETEEEGEESLDETEESESESDESDELEEETEQNEEDLTEEEQDETEKSESEEDTKNEEIS